MTTAQHTNAPRKYLKALPIVAAVLALTAVTGACSSSAGTSAPTGSVGHAAGHAIHVLASKSDGTKTQLDFGEGTELNHPPPRPSTTALKTKGLRPLDFGGGTGIPVGSPPTIGSPGDGSPTDASSIFDTAWVLVERAALQCQLQAPYIVSLPPWSGDLFYIYEFMDVDNGCAEWMTLQQNMLCVADKLAEIGDAVGTVVWPALDSNCTDKTVYASGSPPTPLNEFLCNEWDIPPQADADRFIVRDLAIHTLAMIPTLDATKPRIFQNNSASNSLTVGCPASGGGVELCDCTEAYADVANGTMQVTDDASSRSVFSMPMNFQGTPQFPVFPPSNLPITTINAPTIAMSALQVKAQILRGGARLLHDLIRRDVYSDLASAAKLSAQALDPDLGAQIEWGQGPQGPYGTLAHAARVLAGRWEIGDSQQSFSNHGDPQCEGVTALNILTGAFGNDLSARDQDRPIRTKGEALAANLVESAGLVVPTCAIGAATSGAPSPDGSTPTNPLRTALVDQLIAEHGTALPSAQSIFARTVATVSDAELAFGYEHALRTFRLLTDSPEPPAGNCTPYVLDTSGLNNTAGLKPAAKVAPSVASVKGIVVDGGIPRSRLVTDPIARSAGLLQASECNQVSPFWDDLNNELVPGMNVPIPPSFPTPPAAFQDSFALGQAFGRRLTMLRDRVSGTDPTSESIARGAMGEVRSWAGSAFVVSEPFTQSGSTSVILALTGMDYSDLGIPASLTGTPNAAEDTALTNALGFVYGPPWVAECAAHVRPDCPANFDRDWIEHPQPGVPSIGGSTAVPDADLSSLGDYGIEGISAPVLLFTLPLADAMKPYYSVSTTSAAIESHLYMVLLRDPVSPGHGRVLGTIPLTLLPNSEIIDTSQTRGFFIAPMQQELLEAAIDLGKWVGAAPPRIGDVSAAQSPGYCIDGIPRDIFVPLQNELTSDVSTSFENSWQHYLNIAQQAAATADTLAQDIIQQNLQIAMRAETADEQLAQLCGDFGVVSQVKVDNTGHVTPTTDDQSLDVCFNEPTTDVVFFSDPPQALTSLDPGSQTSWLQTNVIQCSPGSPGASDPLCKKSSLTFDSFKLVEPYQTPTPANTACGNLPDILGSFSGGFKGTDFRKLMGDDTFGVGGMQMLAASLKMNVDLSDSWNVTFGGKKIMDTLDQNLWPGCMLATGGTSACNSVPTASLFNAAFRYCPGNNVNLQTTPLGCDGGNNSAELNMLKWRVAAALWDIAASAGGMPDSMFNIPVPVVTWPPTPTGPAVFVGAVYSGQLVQGSTLATSSDWTLTNASVQDVLAIGTAHDIAPSFTDFTTNAKHEIPFWYTDLYTNALLMNGPKHVLASNTPLTWTNCALAVATGANAASVCTDSNQPVSPTPIPFTSILDTSVWILDGLKCSTPYGGPPESGAPQLADLMTGLKTGYDTSNIGAIAACQTDRFGTFSCPNNDFFTSLPLWSLPRTTQNFFGLANPKFLAATVSSSSPFGYTIGDIPPSGRVYAFVSLASEVGNCGALSQMLGATTIACAAQASEQAALTAPPEIDHLAEIPLLENWMKMAGKFVSLSSQQLYTESIPKRVVTDIQNGQVGSGNKSGTHGQNILDMEQALQNLPHEWTQIGANLSEIKTAITTARLAIQAANLQEGSQLDQIAQERIKLEAQNADSVWGWVGKIAALAGGLAACVATDGVGCVALAGAATGSFVSVVDVLQTNQAMESNNSQLNVLSDQSNKVEQAQQTQVQQALNGLNSTTPQLWAAIQTSMDNIHTAVLKIESASSALQLTTGQAAYQAAVGTGADFVNIAGTDVPIPVNTVLRRQASGTLIRYQAALKNAKALAYMARRAIEQRLGVPLSALTTPVGPLDPPASWADDVCSLTGVNFQALATATPADAGGADSSAEQQAINQFADSFIGDYVAKLSNFVQYFNVQYPSHEGDDTAVLSLRSDLLGPVPTCQQLAPNLLLNSGSLDIEVNTTVSKNGAGWVVRSCDPTATKCLNVVSGDVLAAPQDGPSGPLSSADFGSALFTSASTGVTWLFDTPSSGPDGGTGDASASDGGAGDAATDAAVPEGGTTGSGIPAGVVYQAVSLSPGTYVLSWWDQARDSQGNLPSSAPTTEYVARVLDGSFRQVAEYNAAPFFATQTPADAGDDSGAGSILWSPRRSITFSVAAPGVYYVAFGASLSGDVPGSVAVADVQLEVTQASNVPTTYVATGSSRVVTAYNCPRSDADLRNAFQHKCDANGKCWYDLAIPVVIDTQTLNNGGSPLAGKLARGNYNYRHIDLSVNLVGTGVRDCTQNPTTDCFATGYIEYDLQHDATSAGITDYNNNTRFFDFGIASVQHGKALAAERYITMPIGTSDQSLLSQPGIQHIEMRGRPLDGTYNLRIWDSPALKFSQLQDVQIILNYRYWSEIVANNIGSGRSQ